MRNEPDADLHFEGTGETAYGTRLVIVAARSEEARGRIILDAEWVPEAGGEAKVAIACFARLGPLVPGAQGVVYNTALRGVHHQTLLRQHGWLPVNRMTAAVAGSNKPRRAQWRRGREVGPRRRSAGVAVGRHGQQGSLLGFVLMVNSLGLHEDRQLRRLAAAA